jgi:hypothetical protein
MEGKTRNEKRRGGVAITLTLPIRSPRQALRLTFRLSQFPRINTTCEDYFLEARLIGTNSVLQRYVRRTQ